MNKNKKYPEECKCEACQENKQTLKCPDCGKMSTKYVHAIGWECLNKKCKSHKMVVGTTFKDLLNTMNKLASSPSLRKKVEKEMKAKGMDITIDECGIGRLYTPLYISRPPFSETQKKWDKILYNISHENSGNLTTLSKKDHKLLHKKNAKKIKGE